MNTPLDYAAALKVVDQCIVSGIKLGLENTRRLLAVLDNPHEKLRYVHVAGTNGKGSVCAMLAAALSAAGYRTGLYTSPHLVHLRERIRVEGAAISEAEFAQRVTELQAAVQVLQGRDPDYKPTFFEFMTVLAFQHYYRTGTQIVVLEVGMGGRLDSTNVIVPEASVITTISFDHTHALGHTRAAIAGEKAGIIKAGVPVICGERHPEALERIAAVAAARQAPLVLLGREFEVESFALEVDAQRWWQANRLRWQDRQLEARVALLGRHQAENCAVVLATLATLRERGWQFSLAAALAGLLRARWPARLQRLPDGLLIDGAHNESGMACAVAALDRIYPGRRFHVLFAVLRDKPWQAMLELLAPRCASLCIAQVEMKRALEAPTILAWLQEHYPALPVTLCATPAEGLARIRAAGEPLVIGSLYLAGAVLAEYSSGNPVEVIGD